MPTDKFGQPYFYPNKPGGFNFEQSNNPKNDNAIEGLDSSFSVSGDVITMHPKGPTSFSVGKNARGFTESIGGCGMDFKATAARGYAYKKDDVRDLEFKCLMRVKGLQSGHDGFSMSACTGRHTSSNCCQGFAYMGSLDGTNSNPTLFRFRKETVHVQYTDSPEGSWSHPKMNFKVDGHGWIGFGFCRYNDPASPDDTVILEIWANPNPDADITNWIMLKRHKDKPGDGWTGSANKCQGDKDQIGTWSGAHNRLKSNSSGGTIEFKNITFREIDSAGSFDTPPPVTCSPGQHLSGGVCVPDTNPPVNCPPGQHNENGICVPDSSGGSGGGGVGSPLSYTFGFKFGSNGTGNGQFLDPHDISFEASGNLFICDRGRSDVQKFTPTGTYISKFGGPGSGNGQFNVPYAVQHDPTYAFIYICDKENSRVQKLSSTGTWISNITTVNGQAFNKPEDITFDKVNGDMYILDTGNDRCVKLNSAHTFILQWGTTGSGNGQFQHPHSINTDSNRDVFISCGNQPYIQKFTPTGTFIKKWGTLGDGPGQTRTFLEHMDIDLHDRVHLVNNDVRPIVNVWDNQGVWLTQYGKTTSGNADGQFKEPEHVTVDSTGKPYVVDAKNQRIQIFNVNEPVAPPGSLTKKLYYAMVSSGAVVGAAAIPTLTGTISHEIVETQTSADPLGTFGLTAWKNYNVNPILEVADECNTDVQFPSGLWANGYWSNSDANCVVPHVSETDLGNSTKFTTRGGKVLNTPGIYLIYWGTTWRDGVSAPTNATLTDLIQNKLLSTNSEYFSKLSQYGGIATPIWKSAVFNVISTIPTGNNITDVQGRQMLVDSFNNGLIPLFAADDENIYVLVVPTGKTPTYKGTAALGFHDVFNAILNPIPDPGGGGVGGPPPPTTTSRVQGSLRLLWDINTVTGVGACSGTGGGGGSGGGGGGTAFAFYTELPDGTLGNNALDDHRTGIYETINTDTAAMKGKRPIRIDLWLAKVGSPAGTATVLHRSAPASASYVKETFGTIDVTTLTTTETMYSFGPTAGTQDFNKNNKIGIEYTNGDANNYITVARNKPGGFDGQKSFKVTKEDGLYVDAISLDLCAVIYEA